MNSAKEMLRCPVEELVAAVAAKQPTPGGGSVAGLVAALATALGEMSLNFTAGKKKFAAHAEAHARLARRLGKTRRMFLDLIADDMTAYGMYAATAKLSAGPEKTQAEALALAAAIDVPREMAKLTLVLLDDLLSLADKCNPYLVSDLIAAGALAAAVTTLCDLNVRINAKQLADPQAAADLRAASAADRAKAHRQAGKIEEITGATLDGIG